MLKARLLKLLVDEMAEAGRREWFFLSKCMYQGTWL